MNPTNQNPAQAAHTATHTPTPWYIDSDGDGKPDAVITSTHDADGPDDDVCEVYGGNCDDDATRAANARFIVTACNAHGALVSALEGALANAQSDAEVCREHGPFALDLETIVARETALRSALALAKGGAK